jgi:hypothetical protein
MNDPRAGVTRLFLPTLEVEGAPKGRFLDAVREAAKGEFEILGELGRRTDGEIAYLARDLSKPGLVALRLEPNADDRHDYAMTVLEELDGSLPATGGGCQKCYEPLRGWGRYCPKCGHDLSGVDASGAPGSGAQVEALVKRLTGGECDILGEMRRAEGGGTVYFAKQEGEDTIVGIRLRKGEGTDYEVERATEISFLPGAVRPHEPSRPGDRSGSSVPLYAAPTLRVDSLEASHDHWEEGKPESRPGRVPKLSRSLVVAFLVVVVVVVVVVILGIVFGARLAQ